MNTTSTQISTRLRGAARRGVLALLLASTLSATACFGRFPITRELYKFNKDASSNEFVQTIVFWVFCLLPYPGGLIVDSLVLNAIEFWTGNTINLADAAHSGAVAKKIETAADGGLVITVALPSGEETMLALKPVAAGEFALIGTNGRTAAIIKQGAKGEAMFYSPDGQLLRTLPAPGAMSI